MMIIRNFAALTVTIAVVAFSHFAFAQDDLDDLLKDLEGEKKPAATAAKPAEEAKAKTEEKSAEAKAEEKPAEAKAEEKAEVKAETKPAEAKAEEKAEVKAETKPVEAKAEEKAEVKAEEKPAEAKAEEKAEVKAETKPTEQVADAKQDKSSKPKFEGPDAELLDNLSNTERLRRKAFDEQALREINLAREAMNDDEYAEAVRHYGLAKRYLNDRPASKNLVKECDQGIAEGLYRAALAENKAGRFERAMKFMENAQDMRHPKARRILEKWRAANEENVDKPQAEVPARSDEKYKEDREQIRKHLRRSRQYLALRDMKRALEEVEVVLVADPYNQDAIRLRKAIQNKRKTILLQERESARDGMIADVDEAWRPVYAVNAARLNAQSAETVKNQTGEDPERTMEQDIERRMKEMRLPTIQFKPPATIIDAVEFFRQASKDYDRPDIPIEKRGFNFVLRTPQGAIKTQQVAKQESDDFGSNDNESTDTQPTNGLEPIQTINASDISFHEALKLVCDSVGYKFIVRGPVVMVMPQDMSTAELLSRKYDVLDAFLERMTSASSDVKEMKSQGFGGGNNSKKSEDGDENQERDWKAFFEQMGVKWPEGSSIMYIKTLGKLYVRNTRENLAEFEKVLQEMGSQPKLIEIETRFVEVAQADLNSLGFEWILNSDYSLNLAGVSDKLIRSGVFGSESGSTGFTTDASGNSSSASTYDSLSLNGGAASVLTSDSVLSGSSSSSANSSTYSRTVPLKSNGGTWISNPLGDSNLGINAFGGTSEYGNGSRYLSTVGNHISGESKSTNDQFMRVNAFLGDADLSMILHMLSQRSDTDLLSAPKVVTKSGENAVIKVVTEYIYPQDYDVQLQSSSSSSGGSSSSSGGQSAILAVVEPQNFTMREVGVILDVTPTYSEANGGTIDLEIKPQVVDEPIWHNYGMRIPFTGNSSSGTMADIGNIFTGMSTALATIGATLSDADKEAMAKTVVASAIDSASNVSTSSSANMTWYDAPMEQPWFHVRSIDSKVSITPGATVVMGGLITESRKAMDDKIPFLGDLPYIGRLFRSHAEQTTKRNLLIFVTGRLITPAGRELRTNDETLESEGEVKAAPKAE